MQTGLEISVMSHVDWTDTGLDVVEGQEIIFRAVGQISLQKGNPVTYCGPDGYNYQSLQQPIQDKNIGALIGKVYFLISVEVDEETGEEIRNEREEIFYIGSSNRIAIPMDGRLYLGINENLVVDNDGVFHVLIYTYERSLCRFFLGIPSPAFCEEPLHKLDVIISLDKVRVGQEL